MQIYPHPTSCTESGGWITVTFNICRVADKATLATGISVSVPAGTLSLLADTVRNRLSEWLVVNVFAGDVSQALNACIATYSDADWMAWGI